MPGGPRDIYVPAVSWQNMVDTVAAKPRSIDPAFTRALEPFQRYAVTIQGEIGEAIRLCQDHLERFLSTAQQIVSEESGENKARLGRPREFPHGTQSLIFQVFNYRGEDTVQIREDRFADLVNRYDRFNETMQFMVKKVEEGDLGVLKNSFLFIHKPLKQAAALFDKALINTRLRRTTVIGEPADPHFVHIVGTEVTEAYPPKCIVRVLKPGYAYEGREIQEGAVIVATDVENEPAKETATPGEEEQESNS